MYLRTILIVFVLAALALFTAANWHAFTTATTLSVIFATFEAPLGLVLLGMVVLLAALFLIYVVYLQSSVLFETRATPANCTRSANLPSMPKSRASMSCARFWKLSYKPSASKPSSPKQNCRPV